MKTLIVIPAYNEQDSIVGVVEEVVAAGYDYVIINDGSIDRTLDVCREHGYKVISLPQNLGIGGAVQTGHMYAYRNGYDADIQIDGDGQHDIACAKQLIQALEDGADLVIGSRFLEATDGFQSTFMRRVGIKWLSFIINFFTGFRPTDATSGLRASGRRALRLFAEHYPTDYPEPESIVTALKTGLVVQEVPAVMRARQGGASSINAFSSVYYMIKVTLAIVIESAKTRKASS